MLKLLLLAFCWHKRQTTPRRDSQGEYRRCLECAARLPWRLADVKDTKGGRTWRSCTN